MISDYYTSIHNEVLEKMAKTNLSAYEWRVMMIIWRRTYGMKRLKVAELSTSYISLATNLDKRNVSKVLLRLQKKNFIFREGSLVGFNKHFDETGVSVEMTKGISTDTVSLQIQKVSLQMTKVIPTDTNKERLKKDKKEKPQEKKIFTNNSSPLGDVSTQTQTSYSNRLESRRIFVEKIRKAVTPIIESKFNRAAACTFQNDMLGVEAVKANWTEREHELYKAWVHYKTFYAN